MRRLLGVVMVVGLLMGALEFATVPAGAFAGGPWSPPVSGPVVRGFDPPTTRFGPGHLGVDFAVPPGTAVHAAGDGVVVFAGRVGEGLHVVVLHPGGIRTTDSFLAAIFVVKGEAVVRGAVVGTSGGTGPGHPANVLHFGVRIGDDYVDPMLLFAPPDLTKVVHLAEPHGGAFGRAPGPPVAASTGEAAAIAAALRVDARRPARRPPWWRTAAATRSVAARPEVADPTAIRPPPSAPGPTGPTGATVVGAATAAALALGVGLTRRRLRHRA